MPLGQANKHLPDQLQDRYGVQVAYTYMHRQDCIAAAKLLPPQGQAPQKVHMMHMRCNWPIRNSYVKVPSTFTNSPFLVGQLPPTLSTQLIGLHPALTDLCLEV